MSLQKLRESVSKPTLLLGIAVVLAGGATYFGLRARPAPEADSLPTKEETAQFASPPEASRPAAASDRRSGLDLLSGTQGMGSSDFAPSGSLMNTRDAGPDKRQSQLARQLSAAFGDASLDGAAGEPGLDEKALPAQATAGEDRLQGKAGGGTSPAAAASRAAPPSAQANGSAGQGAANEGGTSQASPQLPPTTPVGILLSHFRPPERSRLMSRLEQGIGLVPSCKASGLQAQCMSASLSCAKNDRCERWLTAQLNGVTASEAARFDGGGQRISGPGAEAGESLGLVSTGEKKEPAPAKPAVAPKAVPTPIPTPKPTPTPTPTPTPMPMPVTRCEITYTTIRLPLMGTIRLPFPRCTTTYQ